MDRAASTWCPGERSVRRTEFDPVLDAIATGGAVIQRDEVLGAPRPRSPAMSIRDAFEVYVLPGARPPPMVGSSVSAE